MDTVPVSPRVQRLMTSPLPVDRTLLNSPPASATAGAAGTQGGTPIVATPSKVGFNVPVSPREAGFAAAPSTPSGIRQRRTGRANGTNPERQFTYSEIDVPLPFAFGNGLTEWSCAFIGLECSIYGCVRKPSRIQSGPAWKRWRKFAQLHLDDPALLSVKR
ncbi:hypothetical protein FS842_002812 [Serendipita sp. 407]|nr:hypothetical protein FS842_002812 [Serendipita sp. 407]